MTGSGNDFIIIDNRALKLSKERGRELARLACRRKLSVGADGLILIENDSEADFAWQFFNADGSEAEMCGNGSRCAARFALLKGIVNRNCMSFKTLAGLIEAQITGERAKVRMPDPHSMEMDVPIESNGCILHLGFINTGVPHEYFSQTRGLNSNSLTSLNWDVASAFIRGFSRRVPTLTLFSPAASTIFSSGPLSAVWKPKPWLVARVASHLP